MDEFITALLNSDVERIKGLFIETPFNYDGDKLKDLVDVGEMYNNAELIIGQDEDYIVRFEEQKRKFLELLEDDDEGKSDEELFEIGFDFFLFALEFVHIIVVNLLLDAVSYYSDEDKWYFCEIAESIYKSDKEVCNYFFSSQRDRHTAAVIVNRTGLLNRYLKSKGATEETVKRFLQLDINVDCPLYTHEWGWGLTSLYFAIYNKNIAIVKLLLEHGANPNIGQHGSNLACAVEQGQQDIVELLLEHGVCVDGDRENDRRSAPITYAALRGDMSIVELLLRRGARIDKGAMIELVGISHPGIAEKYGTIKALNLLLDLGCDVNFTTGHDTVLGRALDCKEREIVKFLLDNGAQVNKAVPNSEEYPLHRVLSRILWGSNDIHLLAQLLLDYGADINKECRGMPALAVAVSKNYCNNYCYKVSKVLVRHARMIKALGSFVSEANLKVARKNDKLAIYSVACDKELEVLKSEKFDDSTLSYLDILGMNGSHKLASLAKNEGIRRAIKSQKFKKKFPIYHNIIAKKFDKGIAKKKDLDLLHRFISYLKTRDHDQLPQLPDTFVSKLFHCMNYKDFVVLRKL